jgi:hypothetical protein
VWWCSYYYAGPANEINMSKNAVITIPPGIHGMDCQSNDVHPIVMINALQMLQKHFAREIVAMAEKAVGKNPKLQAQYMDRFNKTTSGRKPW